MAIPPPAKDWDLAGPTYGRKPLPLMSSIKQDIFGGDKYRFGKMLGEIRELLVELLHGRLEEARAEFEQVVFDLQHLVHNATGFDFVPVGCAGFVEELYTRLAVWEGIFTLNGFAFHPRHLRAGSNYLRPEKVAAALASAKAEADVWRL